MPQAPRNFSTSINISRDSVYFLPTERNMSAGICTFSYTYSHLIFPLFQERAVHFPVASPVPRRGVNIVFQSYASFPVKFIQDSPRSKGPRRPVGRSRFLSENTASGAAMARGSAHYANLAFLTSPQKPPSGPITPAPLPTTMAQAIIAAPLAMRMVL